MDMPDAFPDKLRAMYAGLTRSERSLASYFLNHLQTIPFETVSAIAEHVGVSEMTVIRFVRTLGYANLKDLKRELKGTVAGNGVDLDDVLERFRIRRDGSNALHDSLELELRSLIAAYDQAATEKWREIVALLARCDGLNVVGFQASKGLALDFATRLQYVRQGVRFIENVTGGYVEVLGEPAERSCLVLIDTAAYARDSFRLCAEARQRKLPLVIVTDKFSHWAFDYTDKVLQVSTHANTFWDSTVGLAALLNLLINALALRLGDRATQRFRQADELGGRFEAFDWGPRPPRGSRAHRLRKR
jgi:DNA-binding MurR/RpiR family transcriptional regulator